MHFKINTTGVILTALLGLSCGSPINHANDNTISKRLQPTVLPSSIEYLGCWCSGIELFTFRSTNITLRDSAGQVLANANGTCSYYKEGKTGSGCSLLGDDDVTVGGYLVHHPDAYFGPCGFNSSEIQVSIPNANGPTQSKNLTVSCFSGTDACAPFGNICSSNTAQASTIKGGSV